MRRVFLPILGLIVLGLGTAPHAVDWPTLVKPLKKSVVTIQRDEHGVSCSGFVINSRAKNKKGEDVDYILTCNHCAADAIWADQSEARVVSKVADKDLNVLEIEDTGRPALKLADENPVVGQEVASFGYGYALDEPLFRVTHISAETYIPYEGIGGPLFFTDTTFVPGQSGGPVVNAAGEVVMIVQMGDRSAIGLGVGAETIRSKVGKYWEKTVKP